MMRDQEVAALLGGSFDGRHGGIERDGDFSHQHSGVTDQEAYDVIGARAAQTHSLLAWERCEQQLLYIPNREFTHSHPIASFWLCPLCHCLLYLRGVFGVSKPYTRMADR
jgi:hypothetical protein